MAEDIFIANDICKVDFTYLQRKVSSLSLGGVVKKHWIYLIRNTVDRCSKIEYLASTFFNFHILKLLKNNKIGKEQEINDDFFSNSNKVRPFFVGVCEGCRISDESVNNSLKEWKDIFINERNTMPLSNGLNTILTKLFERYYVAFKNYNNIAIVNHYSWYLADKYEITKKSAQKLADYILIPLMKKKKSEEENLEEYKNEIKQNEKEIVTTETTFLNENYKLLSFSERIRFHYFLQTKLDSSNNDEHKSFSIAPICSLKTTYISICAKKTLKDLYKFVVNTCIKKKMYDKFNLNLETLKEIEEMGEPNELLDVFIDNKKLCRQQKARAGYKLSPEFKSNGIENIIMYEKIIQKSIKITQNEFQKKEKKRKELELKKANSTDIRVTRIQYPSIEKDKKVFPSTKEFNILSKGYFAKTALIKSTIEPGTPIVSIDPGHKNILTCANFKFPKNQNDEVEYEKGYSLSLGEYYNKIGNKRMRIIIEKKKKKQKIDEIEAEWSRHTLKTSDIQTFKSNLRVQLNNWDRISSFYRKTEHVRMRFDCKQKQQRFIMKIINEIAPNENTIIAMGSAKFTTNCKGLSSTPIAKITRYLTDHRRVVLTPEQFTTCRCFGCKNIIIDKKVNKMKDLKGNQIKENFKGKKYHVKIHGLKQCLNCRKFWNRDYVDKFYDYLIIK